MNDATLMVRREVSTADSEFERYYRQHREQLRQTAFKLTGSDDRADDLVAEAFAKAWEAFGRFRGESSFSTWIYRILVNIVYNSNRSVETELDESQHASSGTSDPHRIMEARHIGSRIDSAVGRLSSGQRTVFLHRELDNMKHAEIAKRLGITESTSKVHYFHALKKLQGELHDLV